MAVSQTNRAAHANYIVPRVAAWTVPGLVWPTLPMAAGRELLALSFQLARSQWWPESLLRAAQFDQLDCLVNHAWHAVPFYRDRLSRAGYDPDCPLTPELWPQLPILTRPQAQEAGSRLFSEHVPPSHGEITTRMTSGSTGTPLVAAKTALAQQYYEAIALREIFWHRRDLSGKYAVIRSMRTGEGRQEGSQHYDSWGAPASNLFRTGPCVALDIFNDPAVQVEWLVKEAPDYLLSMPSNLRLIAGYAREKRIRLPPLKEVRSYGEAFEDDFPVLCREVWGAKHSTVYSTNEIGIIATQCPEHPHFHVDCELTHLEVLDDAGRPCGPGEIGRVVVTSLHNFAMPLLRYEVGDLAELGDPCPCGRGLPVLRRVLGRTRDVLTLPSGAKKYLGTAGPLFSKFPMIVQKQMVQKSPTEIDLFLVARRQLTADEETRLRSALAENIADGINFRISYVDSIPRNREGKYYDFRSEIPAPSPV